MRSHRKPGGEDDAGLLVLEEDDDFRVTHQPSPFIPWGQKTETAQGGSFQLFGSGRVLHNKLAVDA